MLQSIYVDGLKSLNDFRLEFRPGLNVLIGPNGAGKSNILSAIDLIADVVHSDSLNGKRFNGTTEIAQLFDIYREDKRITVTIEGQTEAFSGEDHLREKEQVDRMKLTYKYAFEIVYQSQNTPQLFFANQSLDLGVSFDRGKKLHELKLKYCDGKLEINTCDDLFLQSMVKDSAGESDSAIASDLIAATLNRGEVLKFRSLVAELSLVFPPLKSVLCELQSGITYDIDPAAIRKNFGNLVAPFFERDGSGLQSVLLEICEKIFAPEHPQFGQYELHENYQDTYQGLVFHLQLFLPELSGLRLRFDPEKGEILGDLLYENKAALPIELMSRGSLKLLTLLTLLLTARQLTVLEEPENFMHPRMQQQMIELMRDTVDDRNEIRLFTTHCETIINLLEPEEIIYTKYKDGHTQAGRFASPDQLRTAIYETGAGLGWYYVSRALDNRRLV